jgi:hypothetical protein
MGKYSIQLLFIIGVSFCLFVTEGLPIVGVLPNKTIDV